MKNSKKLSINEFSNVKLSKVEMSKVSGGRKRYFIGAKEVSKGHYDCVAGTSH